jgi:hypothetical protein
MIYREQEESEEMYFVTDGKYDVGYCLNNKYKYRLQFGDRTVIGGYEMCNEIRINFNFKAHNTVSCFSIRRKNWFELKQEFFQFTQSLHYHFVVTYSNGILKPLHKMKTEEVK